MELIGTERTLSNLPRTYHCMSNRRATPAIRTRDARPPRLDTHHSRGRPPVNIYELWLSLLASVARACTMSCANCALAVITVRPERMGG